MPFKSSTDDQKPLSHYLYFAANKLIQLISKGVLSIYELRGDNLLLFLENKVLGEKFIKSKELTGICRIKAKY